MLKNIAIAVLVVLGLATVFIATRPDTFVVKRETTIQAPPEIVLGQITDFHQWQAWSPWAKLDPNQKLQLDGTPNTVGQTYYWSGSDKVGEGKMTMTSIDPGKRAEIKLEFLKPFAATNMTEFTVTPAQGAQTLTWSMSGKNNFLSKAMSVVMDMDKMVGGDFEKGLASIKTVAEEKAKAAAQPPPTAEAPQPPPVLAP